MQLNIIQQIFVEYLLYTGTCPRCLKYFSEHTIFYKKEKKKDHFLYLCGACILSVGDIHYTIVVLSQYNIQQILIIVCYLSIHFEYRFNLLIPEAWLSDPRRSFHFLQSPVRGRPDICLIQLSPGDHLPVGKQIQPS